MFATGYPMLLVARLMLGVGVRRGVGDRADLHVRDLPDPVNWASSFVVSLVSLPVVTAIGQGQKS